MLDRLRSFEAVARHRNVTRASTELHITQPAVTKHLRQLEEAFSAHLYKRGGEGIELTQIGRVFLQDVTRLLKQYARLKRDVDDALERSKTESLTVGGSYSPSASLLPSLLASFKKAHPHLQLNLKTGNKIVIERMVLNGEVDIAVVNNAPANRLLTMEPYRNEPMIIFASKRHPLAKKRQVTLHDVSRFPLLIRKPLGVRGTTEHVIANLKKQGFRVNIGMCCESPEIVKALVKRQMGLGLLFKETVEPEIRKGEFKIIKVPAKGFQGQSFILYRRDRQLLPVGQAFLELLRKHK